MSSSHSPEHITPTLRKRKHENDANSDQPAIKKSSSLFTWLANLRGDTDEVSKSRLQAMIADYISRMRLADDRINKLRGKATGYQVQITACENEIECLEQQQLHDSRLIISLQEMIELVMDKESKAADVVLKGDHVSENDNDIGSVERQSGEKEKDDLPESADQDDDYWDEGTMDDEDTGDDANENEDEEFGNAWKKFVTTTGLDSLDRGRDA